MKTYDELVKENKQLLKDYYIVSKTCVEQKAEIERLTRELNDTVSMNEMYVEKTRQNAELQKQVDGLTDEKEDLYFQNKNLQTYIDNHEPIWKRNTEQAVKDTAKEILDELETVKQYAKDTYGLAEKVGVDIAINVVKKILRQKCVEV